MKINKKKDCSNLLVWLNGVLDDCDIEWRVLLLSTDWFELKLTEENDIGESVWRVRFIISIVNGKRILLELVAGRTINCVLVWSLDIVGWENICSLFVVICDVYEYVDCMFTDVVDWQWTWKL